MRTSLIAGNWKMNTTMADAHVLANGVKTHVEDFEHCEVVLCPPSIWLADLAQHVVHKGMMPHLKLGAQNMYFEDEGAFTGEISPLMVKEVAEYVIIGHSERTHIFKEDPELVNKKVRAAFDHGITPILCLGEDEQGGDSVRRLGHLLDHLIIDVTAQEIPQLVVAYEPVWAIGSGNPATAEYAQGIAHTLRLHLSEHTRILYGGSVSQENAKQFLQEPDIDGLLIGGLSLKLKPFVSVCQMAEDLS